MDARNWPHAICICRFPNVRVHTNRLVRAGTGGPNVPKCHRRFGTTAVPRIVSAIPMLAHSPCLHGLLCLLRKGGGRRQY